jgi:PAS domain S-box-containing protein
MADHSDLISFLGDPPAAAQERQLPHRRELALVAFERSRMPMMVSDPRQIDNPVVLANQAFLDLTGFTADEVIGRNCRFLQGPDTEESAIATLRDALALGDDHVEIEMLNYRQDGSAFWNQLAVSAVRSDSGELLYYFGSQKDVTARRQAEALEANERRLLLEVDHRAMNALALVQSIVRLTRADNASEFARSVSGRVNALARAHQILAAQRWTHVDLCQLIETQTSPHSFGQMAIGGPPTNVCAHVVQPLALVLHEMHTNASTHGGLSNSGGRASLSWEVDGSLLTLRWHEEGPSLAQAPKGDNFGLRIVRNTVEAQLRGRMLFEWHDGALDASFIVPGAAECHS